MLPHSLSFFLSDPISPPFPPVSDVDDEPEPTEPDYTLRPGLKIDDIGESYAQFIHT